MYTGKNEQGESLFQQKKYFLWTFSELHGILNREENFQPSIFTQDPKRNTLYKVKYQK